MPFASEIILFTKGDTKAINTDFEVLYPRMIEHACINSIVFLSGYNPDFIKKLNSIPDSLIIAKSKYNGELKKEIIHSENPRLTFTNVVNHFWGKKTILPNIEETAIVSKSAQIEGDVYIGHYCVIEDNVTIKKGSIISHHSIILENTSIGLNTFIDTHCVIGQDGYWHTRDGNKYVDLIHCGAVKIGNNVRIGSHTNIDKGLLPNMVTLIEDNVRINKKVHIAHGVKIGSMTRIGCGVIISGEVMVGRNCWISHNSAIKHCIRINDRITVGIGAVVTKDLDIEGTYVGVPALFKRELKSLSR